MSSAVRDSEFENAVPNVLEALLVGGFAEEDVVAILNRRDARRMDRQYLVSTGGTDYGQGSDE